MSKDPILHDNVLQFVAVCCFLWQSVEVCGSLLQSIAFCGSLWNSVAVFDNL